MTIKTAMGLKSNPPKLGRFRLIGPRIGSVTWFTIVLMLTTIGCGLEPLNGMMKERITRAKIAIVKRVSIVLIRLANL